MQALALTNIASTSNDSAQPPTSAPDSRAEEPLDAIDSGAASADQERAGAEFDAIPPDWEGEGNFDDADSPEGTDGPESLLARSSASAPGDDGSEAFERVAQHESLAEHLHRQALSLRLGPADRAALYFLIESLTDDGYLPDPLPSLAEHLCESTDPEERELVLHHLLHLMPNRHNHRWYHPCFYLRYNPHHHRWHRQ